MLPETCVMSAKLQGTSDCIDELVEDEHAAGESSASAAHSTVRHVYEQCRAWPG